MSKIIVVTGGARSGKSVIAEAKTVTLGSSFTYIATAEVRDDEMAERVAVHQARRGDEWQTLHAPMDLVGALRQSDGKGPRLVDCLTLWLTNLILAEQDWQKAAKDLIAILPDQKDPVIFVTNEVGSGIVPENALARRFRDAAGSLNQQVAAAADEVYLAVCGLELQVK